MPDQVNTENTARTIKIVWFIHTDASTTAAEDEWAALVRDGWRIVAAGGGTETAEQAYRRQHDARQRLRRVAERMTGRWPRPSSR